MKLYLSAVLKSLLNLSKWGFCNMGESRGEQEEGDLTEITGCGGENPRASAGTKCSGKHTVGSSVFGTVFN